jgi:PAS domain S-box-containing protein
VIEQAIHPDDRAAVEAANLRVMNEKTPLPLEYRVVWADGSVRTVWAEGGELVMDAEGEPLMLSGVVQDITDRKEMERQMKESEKKYRTFVETAHDLIWEVDAEGKITFMNPAANRIYGYAPEELIGKHWTTNSVKMDEEDAERLANQTQELGGTVEGQISIMRHRDGHRVILRANAVQIFDEGGEYLGAMGTSQDITDLIGLQEEIQQSRDRLRALTQHIQTAIEKERADLSRELHDEFGQILTGLKMDLTWLTKEGLPLSMNNPRVISMFELIDQAISITRRISSELRPSVLDDLGLLSALSWYTDEFVKRTNILCDLSLPGEDPPLDTNLQTDLFRIYQEALTNVARHAKASRVKTSFLTEDDAIIMHIQDNGQGIRPRELQNRKSLGLLGMSERAAKWQGTLDIDGVDGAGTTVSIHIPISQDS